jgi:hypothetical protein
MNKRIDACPITKTSIPQADDVTRNYPKDRVKHPLQHSFDFPYPSIHPTSSEWSENKRGTLGKWQSLLEYLCPLRRY